MHLLLPLLGLLQLPAVWAEAWEVTAGSTRLTLHGAEGVHHDPDNLPLFRSASALAAGAIAERYSGVDSIKAPLRVLDLGSGCGVWGLLFTAYLREATGLAALPIELVFADISRTAVETSIGNAARNHAALGHGHPTALTFEGYVGDLFDAAAPEQAPRQLHPVRPEASSLALGAAARPRCSFRPPCPAPACPLLPPSQSESGLDRCRKRRSCSGSCTASGCPAAAAVGSPTLRPSTSSSSTRPRPAATTPSPRPARRNSAARCARHPTFLPLSWPVLSSRGYVA